MFPPGAEWAAAIIDAIDHCRAMILVFSSSTNESKQIRREVQRAFDREVPVLPFRIENVVPEKALAYYMGPVHWLDALTPPIEQHLQKLAGSVQALMRARAPDLAVQKASVAHYKAEHPEHEAELKGNQRNAETLEPPGAPSGTVEQKRADDADAERRRREIELAEHRAAQAEAERERREKRNRERQTARKFSGSWFSRRSFHLCIRLVRCFDQSEKWGRDKYHDWRRAGDFLH
jgi:septal ring factor EnvC (AmiA/AmiB activator)